MLFNGIIRTKNLFVFYSSNVCTNGLLDLELNFIRSYFKSHIFIYSMSYRNHWGSSTCAYPWNHLNAHAHEPGIRHFCAHTISTCAWTRKTDFMRMRCEKPLALSSKNFALKITWVCYGNDIKANDSKRN